MIFFTDNNGNIIKSLPSPVYQGSANTNTIYLVAPFAVNSQVTVAFKLPNGAVVAPVAMSQQSALQGIKDEAGRTYAGWTYAIPNAVTRYYGVVTAQFFFYAAESGVITATASVRFVVNAGVPAALPDTPDEDVYESILGNIASLQERLNSGYYVARAVFPWNEGATYGTNEIAFYPGYGEYGAFVMSLQEGNTGNLPYSADGTINSAWWKPIADFNALADLAEAVDTIDEYVEQAKQAAEDAQESADAAATSAASAASSARMAGLAADDAQQSASESAQSALESKAYMEQAREYAQKEYQLYDSYADLPRPGDPAFIYLVPNVQSLEYVQKVAAQLAADGVDVSAATERELYAAALAQPIADEGNDSYIEYLWVTNINDYERIGSVNDIDLSEYAKIYGTYPDMTVGKANQLVNARKISVDLASSSPASFDGTKDVAAGVTGILPVANGGTGADDLMDIKVGDSVHADTANDPNAVHFTEQTLTDEQKLQARKNISAAAEEQALKNMYNLGAYDTFTDNGDGTATITRKTKYGDSITEQTEAETSYTEEVILDQPIHTPDVNGEQFVRDEWEKGLNLFNINDKNARSVFGATYSVSGNYLTVNRGEESYSRVSFLIDTIGGKNYFFSANSNTDAHFVVMDGTTDTGTIIWDNETFTSKINASFVALSNKTQLLFYGYPISPTVYSDIMLVEGDHAYPYQPYNGAIVHEKELNDALEDYLPRTGTAAAAYKFDIQDTRNDTSPPSYYFALDKKIISELKSTQKFVNPPPNTNNYSFFTLITVAPWVDSSGGDITQFAVYAWNSKNTPSVFMRKSISTEAWGEWIGVTTEEQLDDALENYLPLSGGTIDGNLNVTEQLQENGARVYSPNNLPPRYHDLPTGGFVGDILAKKSASDYDVQWVPPTGGGADITVTENADGTVNIVIASSNSSGG